MGPIFAEVMKLAVEDPGWMPAVKGCYDFAEQYGNHFAGSWILERPGVGWLPNLKPLVTRGILAKEELTRGGSRRYYRLVEPETVGLALKELGLIAKGGSSPA